MTKRIILVKIRTFRYQNNAAVIIVKFDRYGFHYTVMSLNNAEVMINRVDANQTAPEMANSVEPDHTDLCRHCFPRRICPKA